jgi:hypothetical protein
MRRSGSIDEKLAPSEELILSSLTESVFAPNSFIHLKALWFSAFKKGDTETRLRLFALLMGVINGWSYADAGKNLLDEIDLDNKILEYLLEASIIFANFLQAAQFTKEAIRPIIPWISARNKNNEPTFILYDRNENNPKVTAVTHIFSALFFQSSVAYLVKEVNKSWLKGIGALSEAPLMLAAFPIVKKQIGKLYNGAANLCCTTDEDTVDLLEKKDDGQEYLARVSKAQLFDTRQAIINKTMAELISRIEKTVRKLYQTSLTQARLQDDKNSGFASLDDDSVDNGLSLRKILNEMDEILLALPVDQHDEKSLLPAARVPGLIKLILQNAEKPKSPEETKIRLTLGKQISSGSIPTYGTVGSKPIFAASLRLTDTNYRQNIMSFLLTFSLASVFPLNVAASAGKQHLIFTTIFGFSALIVMGLLIYINNDRIDATVKALRTIRQDGALEWYHHSVRPATWSRTSWKQLPYLFISLVLFTLISQSYSSVLAGLVKSWGHFLDIEGSENLKLLAGILWVSLVAGNLCYNTYFIKSAMDLVESAIDKGQTILEYLFTSEPPAAPSDIEEDSAAREVTVSHTEMLDFNQKIIKLCNNIGMSYQPKLIGLFRTRAPRPDLTNITFLVLFDALVLQTEPDEREEMALKCFGKSLQELQKDVGSAIQQLTFNNQELSTDLTEGLAKLTPLLNPAIRDECTASSCRLFYPLIQTTKSHSSKSDNPWSNRGASARKSRCPSAFWGDSAAITHESPQDDDVESYSDSDDDLRRVSEPFSKQPRRWWPRPKRTTLLDAEDLLSDSGSPLSDQQRGYSCGIM